MSFADVLENNVFKIFPKSTRKHLCWSLFLINFQPATLSKKTLSAHVFLRIFAKFLETPFRSNTFEWVLLVFTYGFWVFTEHLRMTASCVYLWILRSFSEHLFYRKTLGDCSFHVHVEEFQPAYAIKIYFTGAFKVFCTKTRSCYSKVLI